MIRTSHQKKKQVVVKLALHRETIRTLDDSEFAIIVGADVKPCNAITAWISGCVLAPLDGVAPK